MDFTRFLVAVAGVTVYLILALLLVGAVAGLIATVIR